MTDNTQNTNPNAADATANNTQTQPNPAAQSPSSTGAEARSEHCRRHQCRTQDWNEFKQQKRWKLFGAIALIFFLGFMFGRGSSHHHGPWAHRYCQQSMSQPMMVIPYNPSNVAPTYVTPAPTMPH